MISIIIANYNNERYIEDTLISLKEQSYKNFEIIVVDDCSTDKSPSIIKNFISLYPHIDIKYIQNKKNIGAANTRNVGIEFASFEWISILDGDDIFHKDKLKKQVLEIQKNKNIVLIGTNLITINSQGKKLNHYKYPSLSSQLKNNLFNFRKFPAHSSLMFKKDLFYEVGQYDCFFEPSEDFNLFCKLSSYGEIACIQDYLTFYRVHSKSISFKSYNGYFQPHFAICSILISKNIKKSSVDVLKDVKETFDFEKFTKLMLNKSIRNIRSFSSLIYFLINVLIKIGLYKDERVRAVEVLESDYKQ